MTCRPHHALCPARDGGECCCEPLTAEERERLRNGIRITDHAIVMRLLFERDCLERERDRLDSKVVRAVLLLFHERDQLERERDNARRLADRLAYDLRRVTGDCAGCSPHDCATAALLQECQGRERES